MGAGTFAGSDGSRKVTDLELEVAKDPGSVVLRDHQKDEGLVRYRPV